MTPERDAQLVQDFPELFHDRHAPLTESLMAFGCACGDGWEPLIRATCRELMREVRQARQELQYVLETCPGGPEQLDAERQVQQALDALPRFVQIKEKFGGLRLYLHGGSPAAWLRTQFAEALSYQICETCGAMRDVKTYRSGWCQTLCRACADVAGKLIHEEPDEC